MFCGKCGASLPEEAVKWLRKAAEKGGKIAQCNLGFCYYKGSGVEKNDQKAFEWYKKSAEQGYTEAQCNLGDCYNYSIGVARNVTKAEFWYKKAAEQGDKYAKNELNKIKKGAVQSSGCLIPIIAFICIISTLCLL